MKVKEWRDVGKWSPARRAKYADDLMKSWEEKRARRGWLTGEDAVERVRSMLPHGKIAVAGDAREHAEFAKRLPLKPYVSISIAHPLKVPGIPGRGTSIERTFSGPRFEPIVIAVRAYARERGWIE